MCLQGYFSGALSNESLPSPLLFRGFPHIEKVCHPCVWVWVNLFSLFQSVLSDAPPPPPLLLFLLPRLPVQSFYSDSDCPDVYSGSDVGVRGLPVPGGRHCGGIHLHYPQQPAGSAGLHHALPAVQTGRTVGCVHATTSLCTMSNTMECPWCCAAPCRWETSTQISSPVCSRRRNTRTSAAPTPPAVSPRWAQARQVHFYWNMFFKVVLQ